MRTTTTPIALALLVGLGLALTACAQDAAEPGPGPLGTARQPTASPSEVQDEQPRAPAGIAR